MPKALSLQQVEEMRREVEAEYRKLIHDAKHHQSQLEIIRERVQVCRGRLAQLQLIHENLTAKPKVEPKPKRRAKT